MFVVCIVVSVVLLYPCTRSPLLILEDYTFADFFFFFIDNEELHQGNLKFVKKIITVSENPEMIEKNLHCPD